MKADVDQKSGGVKADLAGRSVVAPSRAGASIVRSRLFFKYTFLFVTVVVLALVADGRQSRGVERARITFEIASDRGGWGTEIVGKVRNINRH